MKLTHSKIEKAVAKKDRRVAINAPYLDVERCRLVATDGHQLVVVPLHPHDVCEDVSGSIPVDAIKDARTNGHFIDASDKGFVVVNGRQYARLECTYPDIDRVIPEVPASASKLEVIIDGAVLRRAVEGAFAHTTASSKISSRVRFTFNLDRINEPGRTYPTAIGLEFLDSQDRADGNVTGVVMPSIR